jgi:hypothetical protein
MAGDTSLWPVVVGGLLALGGTMVGVIGTTIRGVAQQRHDSCVVSPRGCVREGCGGS